MAGKDRKIERPEDNFVSLDDYDLEEMSIKEMMEELPDGQVIGMFLDENGDMVDDIEKAKEFEVTVYDENGDFAMNLVSERNY